MKMFAFIVWSGFMFWIGNGSAPRQPIYPKFVKADHSTYIVPLHECANTCRARARAEQVYARSK